MLVLLYVATLGLPVALVGFVAFRMYLQTRRRRRYHAWRRKRVEEDLERLQCLRRTAR